MHKYLDLKKGIEIVHNADLPARSGLGSSSTFTVGLLNALHALNNYMPTKRELALQAIHVEQNLINESVGSQDQTAAAFGGLNKVTFNDTSNIDVDPIWGYTPFTYPINMIGYPAASIPCGFSDNGLPIGLHIIGRHSDEKTIFKLSSAIEKSNPWPSARSINQINI